MTYKILRHKTKEGVYADLRFNPTFGAWDFIESSIPHLFGEYYQNPDMDTWDLVEVEIKEVDKKPSYKIQTVSYGETTISVDHLPAGSKVIIENNEATIITPWIPVTESLPGIGKLVEVECGGGSLCKARLEFDRDDFCHLFWENEDGMFSFERNYSWREIREGE